MSLTQTQSDQEKFKLALGNYPTGVTIITAKGGDVPVGLTANSFASVSLDPLLILWSIDHKASSLETFKTSKHFAIHILEANQQELCKTFASKNVDRFDLCQWSESDNSVPIIDGTFAVLECETFDTIEAGDHTIIIGKVINIDVDSEKDPMLYHRRVFGPIPEEFYKQ